MEEAVRPPARGSGRFGARARRGVRGQSPKHRVRIGRGGRGILALGAQCSHLRCVLVLGPGFCPPGAVLKRLAANNSFSSARYSNTRALESRCPGWGITAPLLFLAASLGK